MKAKHSYAEKNFLSFLIGNKNKARVPKYEIEVAKKHFLMFKIISHQESMKQNYFEISANLS